jgi:hypothetical protein
MTGSFLQEPPVSQVRSHAADSVFRIAMALAPPSAGACHTGSVILTAKLIAGHDAESERRESRPRRSGCRRCPRSGSPAGDGHQPRIIQRAGTRKAAMPGNAAAEPAAAAQATRAQEDAAARSVHLPIPASR